MAGVNYITLEQTWRTTTRDEPISLLIHGTLAQRIALLLVNIKDVLVAAGWVVRYSSDGTARGDFSGDSWADYTDAVRAAAGVAHSWIVLRNTHVGPTGTFEVCLDYSTTQSGWVTICACAAGFNTNGTQVNRPTAAGAPEHTWASYQFCNTGASTGITMKAVGLWTADGTCTRVFTTQYGSNGGNAAVALSAMALVVEAPMQAPSWATAGYVMGVAPGGTNETLGWTYAQLVQTTTPRFATAIGATEVKLTGAFPGIADWWTVAVTTNFAPLSGGVPYGSLWWVSNNATYPGLWGRMADAWVGAAGLEGARYPVAGNKQGIARIGEGLFGCPAGEVTL